MISIAIYTAAAADTVLKEEVGVIEVKNFKLSLHNSDIQLWPGEKMSTISSMYT